MHRLLDADRGLSPEQPDTPARADRPGAPLETSVRLEMEARFGQTFSDVRIHADGAAARSATDEHAAAYTLGSDVFFGTERFDPSTPRGRHLLAHELAHVIQQRSASGPRGTPAGTEGEAEAAARAVGAGGSARIGLAATGIQCSPDDEARKKAKAVAGKPPSSTPPKKKAAPKQETRPTSDPVKAAERAQALVDHHKGRLDPGGKGLTEIFSRSANLSTPQLRRAAAGELETITRFLDQGAPDGRQVKKATVVPSGRGARSFDLLVEFTDGSRQRVELTAATSAPAGRHTQRPTNFPAGKKSKGDLAKKTEQRPASLGDVTGAIERKAVGSRLQINARGPGTAAGSRVVIDITFPADLGIIDQAMKNTGRKIHRNVQTVDFVVRTKDASGHVRREVISYERGKSGFEFKSRDLARPPAGGPAAGPPPPSGASAPKTTGRSAVPEPPPRAPNPSPPPRGRPKLVAEIPRGPGGGGRPKGGGKPGMAVDMIGMLAEEVLRPILPPTAVEKQEQVKFDALTPELQKRLEERAPDIAKMEKDAPDQSVYANITIKIDRRHSHLKKAMEMHQELRQVTLMKVELSYEEVSKSEPFPYPPGFTTFDSEVMTYSERVGGKDPWEPARQMARALIEETRPARLAQRVFPRPQRAKGKDRREMSDETWKAMRRGMMPNWSDQDWAEHDRRNRQILEAAQKQQAAEKARAAEAKKVRQAREAEEKEKKEQKEWQEQVKALKKAPPPSPAKPEPGTLVPSGATAPSPFGLLAMPSSSQGAGLGKNVERWAKQLVQDGTALVYSGEQKGRRRFLKGEVNWRKFASNPKKWSPNLSAAEESYIRRLLNNDYGPQLEELKTLLSD